MPVTDRDVKDWLTRLGVPSAPLVQKSTRTALEFFQQYMPALEEQTKRGFLRGMDLHSEVRSEWLPPGTKVAAFRRQGEALFKLFYTKPGTSVYHLGVVPAGRRFRRFNVKRSLDVLAARAASFVYASAEDVVAGRPLWATAGGGSGVQYIIPHADEFLELMGEPGH
jgi:hypothetical protein